MDFAYLHIVTNHIPIIGVPIGVALLVFGLWRRSDELKTFSLNLFAVLGLAALATFLLGQAGEDFVEELNGISEDAIHSHEDFAKIALASVLLTAIVSALALAYPFIKAFISRSKANGMALLEGESSMAAKPYFPAMVVLPVLALAIISTALLGYTGKLGGMIRHTEFYSTTATTTGADDPRATDTENERPETETDEKSGKRRRGRN